MTAAARLVLAGVLALAAAGCKNREAAEGNKAVSEVLPGSASDAMIPYDTLRSQPPLAPAVAAAGSDAPHDGSAPRENTATEAGADDGAPLAAAPSEAAGTPRPVGSDRPAEAQ